MKSSKDFLILGHGGYLGNYLANNLDGDILEKKTIYNNGFEYKFIINCIGKPDVEFCEQNDQISKYSNADIILDIKKYYPSSKIVNFSSYYVYNDKGFCNEESITTECTLYAKHKLLSEQYNSDGINFRLGKIFGNKNIARNKLFDLIIKSDEIFLDDVLFNPVSTKFVCDILKKIDFLEENIGIYNLANDGVVSHFDYGKYIANYLNLSISINYRHNFEKPFCNHGSFLMSLDKIKKYVKVNHWKHDMDIFLSSYKGFFDV